MIRLLLVSFAMSVSFAVHSEGLGIDEFAEIEARAGIPQRVLYSLALTESGRRGRPWPWTMNYAGKSYYFADRDTLHRAMELLIGRGKTNFDVGVMQIHWRFHSHLFDSTWEATDPTINAQAGARILIDRFNEYRNWAKAIAAYHSKTEHLGRGYLANFAKNYISTKKEKM